MGYRIEYDSAVAKYEVREETCIFPWFLAAAGILILLTYCFYPEVFSALKQFMIPGDDAVTIQAFSAMTDDLRSGAAISDAVEAFCKTVIHGK